MQGAPCRVRAAKGRVSCHVDPLRGAACHCHKAGRHAPVLNCQIMQHCQSYRLQGHYEPAKGEEGFVRPEGFPYIDGAVVDVVLIPAQAHCVGQGAMPFQGL